MNAVKRHRWSWICDRGLNIGPQTRNPTFSLRSKPGGKVHERNSSTGFAGLEEFSLEEKRDSDFPQKPLEKLHLRR
ncbi:hypothetical protein D623_10026266 [Myotis brandtii]|uniref:Uncharacterized protein n=1 Tax=Myotis brandtii TaxID=109478 RepID=S7MFB4_MYOBR|nr:hypothetical protein D623_10026266 [Myotis brandtii]